MKFSLQPGKPGRYSITGRRKDCDWPAYHTGKRKWHDDPWNRNAGGWHAILLHLTRSLIFPMFVRSSNNIEKCGNPFWTFTCATRLAADEYKQDSTSLQTHPSPQEATIRFEWVGISGIVSTINSKNGGPHENGRIWPNFDNAWETQQVHRPTTIATTEHHINRENGKGCSRGSRITQIFRSYSPALLVSCFSSSASVGHRC